MGKNDDETLSLLTANASRLQQEIKEINTGMYDNAYRLQKKRGKEAPHDRMVTLYSLYEDVEHRMKEIQSNLF